MKYPEYKYFDTAIGGWSNRNKVSDKLANYIGKKDTGRTYFRFAQDFLDYCEANKTVRGFSGKCYADYIPIDIDVDGNIEEALKISREFLQFVQAEFEVYIDQIPVWFSGSKGTHIALPINLFGEVEPAEDLPDRFRYIVDTFGDWGFDLTIYEKNRLFRLENTINSKSGLYKIRIPDIMSITEPKLLELAKSTGMKTDFDELYDVMENESLISIMGSYTPIQAMKVHSEKEADNELLELFRSGAEKGNRNNSAFFIARQLKYYGSEKEIALQILKWWNEKNTEPLHEKELEAVVNSAYSKSGKTKERELKNFALSKVFGDVILETCYDAERKNPYYFAKYENGKVSFIDKYIHKNETWYPFEDISGYVPNKAVRLPSKPINYGSEDDLVSEVKSLIHKYVAISPEFETLSARYILFTWVYDRFDVLPYLRVKGDTGTGKSTFLKAVGRLTYKSSSTSGSITPAPIFRIMEDIRGTLIIDEADFERSDTKSEIIKILNEGFQYQNKIMRCKTSDKSNSVLFFDPYGPKILSTRGDWDDRALENRCITEDMDGNYFKRSTIQIREKIFEPETDLLRNKLLMYRFNNYHKIEWNEALWDDKYEPRICQIFVPLMSITDDKGFHAEMRKLMDKSQERILQDRQSGLVVIIAEVIVDEYYKFFRENKKYKPNDGISIKSIAISANEKKNSILGADQDLTPHKTGHIIKKHLNLRSVKVRTGMVLPYSALSERIDDIKQKFGIVIIEGKKAKEKADKKTSTDDKKKGDA